MTLGRPWDLDRPGRITPRAKREHTPTDKSQRASLPSDAGGMMALPMPTDDEKADVYSRAN